MGSDVILKKMKRNRVHYILLTMVTIVLGLGSRSQMVPAVIYPYLGDMFYALMIYFIMGLLFPSWSSLRVAIFAVGICFMIELSQLCQADWIQEIRKYRLGGLILGYGFLWSDLVSYTIGGILGIGIELLTKFGVVGDD